MKQRMSNLLISSSTAPATYTTTYRKNSHRRNGILHTCTSFITRLHALEETFLLSEFLRYYDNYYCTYFYHKKCKFPI